MKLAQRGKGADQEEAAPGAGGATPDAGLSNERVADAGAADKEEEERLSRRDVGKPKLSLGAMRVPSSALAPRPQSTPHVERPCRADGLFDRTVLEIVRMAVADIGVAPKRFQSKLNKESESGASDYKRRWNPLLGADPVAVWRDPADAKYYVINGHQRVALAKHNGVTHLNAIILDVPNEGAARAVGAEINIGEGKGTAMDAGGMD